MLPSKDYLHLVPWLDELDELCEAGNEQALIKMAGNGQCLPLCGGVLFLMMIHAVTRHASDCLGEDLLESRHCTHTSVVSA